MTTLRLPRAEPATAAAAAILGVTPPRRANTWVRGNGGPVVWLGPDEWLVIGEEGTVGMGETDLRAAVVPLGGAAVDVSGQRLTLRLRGIHVRDLLAKGCAVDLHPRIFAAGSSAQTTIGRAGVVLLRGEDADEITVLVRPSFAGYLIDWLSDAAIEYR